MVSLSISGKEFADNEGKLPQLLGFWNKFTKLKLGVSSHVFLWILISWRQPVHCISICLMKMTDSLSGYSCRPAVIVKFLGLAESESPKFRRELETVRSAESDKFTGILNSVQFPFISKNLNAVQFKFTAEKMNAVQFTFRKKSLSVHRSFTLFWQKARSRTGNSLGAVQTANNSLDMTYRKDLLSCNSSSCSKWASDTQSLTSSPEF